MLRRLVVDPSVQDLPAICRERTGDRPPNCRARTNRQRSGQAHSRREGKGYELLPLDAALYRQWLESPGNQPFLEEITRWSVSSGESLPIGEQTGLLLARLARDRNFDGLLVLHVRHRCPMASDTERDLLGILTLGLNEVLPDPYMFVPFVEYRVSILEAASGRPVWRSQVRPLANPTTSRNIPTASSAYPVLYPTLEKLFENLEPAVPKLLTR